jgi:hypothetical protein
MGGKSPAARAARSAQKTTSTSAAETPIGSCDADAAMDDGQSAQDFRREIYNLTFRSPGHRNTDNGNHAIVHVDDKQRMFMIGMQCNKDMSTLHGMNKYITVLNLTGSRQPMSPAEKKEISKDALRCTSLLLCALDMEQSPEVLSPAAEFCGWQQKSDSHGCVAYVHDGLQQAIPSSPFMEEQLLQSLGVAPAANAEVAVKRFATKQKLMSEVNELLAVATHNQTHGSRALPK